ncbi:DUF1289 domain-containing protein [Sphingomonas paeninsulae]|uniref:DUF1289 domain-containing protein n=1 Tax=Sphingomonas paeninsulae TaxID=2319844 RepID=A0A494TMY6_SPHPE|nr:DUF1289 domain-containing protein [Sphingomonas paeninsulae]AYJ87176.1 DUF1289 domain-containing protein [Sphingomonas paeninsulae]
MKVDEVASPCTQICTIDARENVCVGCGRTLDEIGAWSGATAGDRRAILMRISAARFRASGARR